MEDPFTKNFRKFNVFFRGNSKRLNQAYFRIFSRKEIRGSVQLYLRYPSVLLTAPENLEPLLRFSRRPLSELPSQLKILNTLAETSIEIAKLVFGIVYDLFLL